MANTPAVVSGGRETRTTPYTRNRLLERFRSLPRLPPAVEFVAAPGHLSPRKRRGVGPGGLAAGKHRHSRFCFTVGGPSLDVVFSSSLPCALIHATPTLYASPRKPTAPRPRLDTSCGVGRALENAAVASNNFEERCRGSRGRHHNPVPSARGDVLRRAGGGWRGAASSNSSTRVSCSADGCGLYH